MNIALIYASMTGHSRKIAHAVGTELGIPVQNLKTSPKLQGVDLLFLVGGIYGGHPKPELLEFAKALTPSDAKKVVLMTSSIGKLPQAELREVMESNGVNVAQAEYRCKGAFLLMGLPHPNKRDLIGAAEFAREQI